MPRWDKLDWSKSKEVIGEQGKFEDDPRAESYDNVGKVNQTYGTMPANNLTWADAEREKAKKQKPYHLFRKKY